MAIFKSKPEITQATVDKAAIPAGRWRFVTDAEHADAVAALAEIVGKKTAAMPSWERRLGVLVDGSGYTLAVEVPFIAIRGERYHGSPEPPSFSTVAYPLSVGVAILQSGSNPEAELGDRRAKHAAFLQQQDAKRAAEAKANEAHQQALKDREAELQRYHASDWPLLGRLERFAVRLAVLAERRDQGLAADLRKLVADSLAGVGDDAADYPKTEAWFKDLGMEALTPDRRDELAAGAADERLDAVLATVPPGKMPTLRLLHGSEKSALVRGWVHMRSLLRRDREREARAAAGRAAAEPGEKHAAEVRARVQAERAAEDDRLRRAEL